MPYAKDSGYSDQSIQRSRDKNSHFSLQDLLPIGQTLALNPETRTVSLLSDGPMQIVEQQLSANEMRLFVPILESFPHYCPYEILLSYIFHKYRYRSLHCTLLSAFTGGAGLGKWQQELRPVRRALSSLRKKLHRFGLEIANIRERGCNLTSLTIKAPIFWSFDFDGKIKAPGKSHSST